MSDFSLRPYQADDAIEAQDALETISSDWAVVIDDKAVGRLQADELAAAIMLTMADSALATQVAERFLQHHLLEAAEIKISVNGASRPAFTRPEKKA